MILGKGNFQAGYLNFEDMFMFQYDYKNPNSGINFISTGMGYQMIDDYVIKIKELYYPDQNYDAMAKEMKMKFELKQDRWKKAAEKEGLDQIFKDAGLEWREPGCSMCVGVNGDTAPAGERIASTSNRNFVGRQGPGVKTHLMSPAMVAAAAISGHLTDVRPLLSRIS
jgi:hypothetical protein